MDNSTADGIYSLCDPQSFCYYCHRLEILFIQESSRFELHMFNNNISESPFKEPCTLHHALFTWVHDSFREEIRQLIELGVTKFESSLLQHSTRWYRERGALPKVEFLDYRGRSTGLSPRELLICRSPVEGQPGLLKHRFDPKWIDLTLPQQWMRTCTEKHGSRCLNILNSPPCFPAYLIDTELDCLIAGKEGLEYFALSYRWGTRHSFKTQRSSIEHLTVPGGLSVYAHNIPYTISHAMHVVRSMGERYLWVDSICLISDDGEHLTEQLQLMGSIYACAKVTIVASDGDAWTGLHGIQGASRGPSEPRDLPNVFPWLDNMAIIVRDLPSLSGHRLTGSSEYFQRGWTYQEYLLSQRRLIFGKKQIHWSCSCAEWHEDVFVTEKDSGNRTLEYSQIPNIINGKPDFEELRSLMNEYHVREFTHSEDALPGITGLLNILSHKFEGGFLCGLPEAWFDAALMWNCEFWAYSLNRSGVIDTILKQRTLSGKPQSSLPGAVLPSWSWIGWTSNALKILTEEGDFELPKIPSANDYEGLGNPIDVISRKKMITTPITKWFSHETPNSSNKRHIQSFLFPRDERGSSLKYLDQGWITEEFDAVTHFQMDSSDQLSEEHMRTLRSVTCKNVYRHPALGNKYFLRPFHIPQRNTDTQLCNPQQYQYISCKTQRGWFHARNLNGVETSDTSMDVHVILRNDSGIVCGWLQLPSEEEALIFQDAYSFINGASQIVGLHDYLKYQEPSFRLNSKLSKVELVAICQRQWGNVYFDSSDERDGNRELYGVLWISWVHGVAYRKGCGYVKKKMWDESKLDTIELVLG